jgi:Xaa-Pro aminopeptidase
MTSRPMSTPTSIPPSTAPAPGSLAPISVAGRLDALRARFEGFDALLVTTLPNVRYLTGFAGSAALLVVTPGGALLTTDGRYRTQSAEQVAAAGAEVEITIGGQADQRKAVTDFLSASSQVGLEADNVSWSAQRVWAGLLDAAELVPTSNAVEALREVKDEAEIARMERAAAIADAALYEVLPMMSEGVTEEEFGLALDTAMRRGGAEGVAFETIVAAGENSAKPHHHPGSRVIRRGDPVVVDFGATFEGYRSDMTRTFCVDAEPQGDMARVFSVVGASQAAGAAAVKPGIATKEVDDVCRAIIADAGWADRFEHGTGHGVGLDIHEAPTVSQLGTAILARGFVVTVEPGVYLPGLGGVRVEDTLVVTEGGSRPLTRFTKDIHGSLD